MAIHVWTGEGGGASLKILFNDEVVGDSSSLNFLSESDEISVSADPNNPSQINVYHPAQQSASNWNTHDGVQGSGIPSKVSESYRYISVPDSEGNPFNTAGYAGSVGPVTRDNTYTYSPFGAIRLVNNTSTTFTVKLSQDSVTLFEETTDPITGDGSYVLANAGTVTISNEQANGSERMANVSISIPASTILPDGGMMTIEITHNNIDTNNTFSQQIFRDSQPSGMNLTVGVPTLDVDTPKTVTTSGIEWLTLETTWLAKYDNIDNTFADTADPTPFILNAYDIGADNENINASDMDDNTWNSDNQSIEFVHTTDYDDLTYKIDASVSITAYDWGVVDSQSSVPQTTLINTQAETTELIERFNTEDYRVASDLGAWSSHSQVGDDELIVVAGRLVTHWDDYRQYLPHGVGSMLNPNYPLTSQAQSYYRVFPDKGTAYQNATLFYSGGLANTMIMNFSLDGSEWYSLNDSYLGGTLLDGDGAVTGSTSSSITFTLGTYFTSGQIYLRLVVPEEPDFYLDFLRLTWG